MSVANPTTAGLVGPAGSVKPQKPKPTAGKVIGTILIVLIILIVIAVIVFIYLYYVNSTNIGPIDLSKKYYIIQTDTKGTTPIFPTYLNTSKTGFSLDLLPKTAWSITGIGNGTVSVTDNRGVMFSSSNGYISDGSAQTPPATSPSLVLASKSGVGFNVSPFLNDNANAKAGYTGSIYKLTADINILYQDGNVPKLTNEDNIDGVTTIWWRFAPAMFT